MYIRLQEEEEFTDYPLYCYSGNQNPGVICSEESITLNYTKGGSIQLNLIEPEKTPSNTGPWGFLTLLGKQIQFEVDLSHVPYSYNLAFYTCCLQDGHVYKDAQSGTTEVDIMEANRHGFHTTMHQNWDHGGQSVGYGGSVGSQFYDVHQKVTDPSKLYGPGLLIDTNSPFEVTIQFQTDSEGILKTVWIQLAQNDNVIGQVLSNTQYLEALSGQIKGKVNTLVMSLWTSWTMWWLDGGGHETTDIQPIYGIISSVKITTLP